MQHIREYFVSPRQLKKIVDLRMRLLSLLNLSSGEVLKMMREINTQRLLMKELPFCPHNTLIDKILRLFGVWQGKTQSKSEFLKRKKHLTDTEEEVIDFGEVPDELKKELGWPEKGQGVLSSYRPPLEDVLLHYEMNKENINKSMQLFFRNI